MVFVEINRNPPQRDLRIFSGLLIVFSGLIAWRLESVSAAQLVLGIGVTLGLIGLAAPRLIRPVFVGWMIAVRPIAFVVSTTILAAVFYLLVWPLGVLMRLKHRDALRLKIDRSTPTYWLPRQTQRDPRRYFRQY
ncbi:hypothetical protein GC176_27810 [bacterium]|nr:hypothetical protein [bacterium]